MLRSTILLAILIGLATALPLNDTKQMDMSVDMEQSALLIPATELLTNKSVVMESMPKIEDSVMLVDEKMDKMEGNVETVKKISSEITDKVKGLEEDMITDQIMFETEEESMLSETNKLDNLKESEIKTELDIVDITKELKSHFKITNKSINHEEIMRESNELDRLQAKLLKDSEEIVTSMSKVSDKKVLLEKIMEKQQMENGKIIELIQDLKSGSSNMDEFEMEMNQITNKIISESELLSQMFPREPETTAEMMVSDATVPEMIILDATAPKNFLNFTKPEFVLNATMLNATLPEIMLNATLPEIMLNATLPEIMLNTTSVKMMNANLPEIMLNATILETTTETEMEAEELKESNEEESDDEESDDEESDDEESDDEESDEEEFVLEEKEISAEVRSILNKVVTRFDADSEKLGDFITNEYCRSGEKFQYYRSHPTADNKYVECNPWGKGAVKTCPVGRLWDEFHELCATPDLLKISQNLTTDFLQLEEMNQTLTTCNDPDFECMNGGRCVAVEDSFECQCTKRYFGMMCQHRALKNSIFTQIMTDKFNFEKFKTDLAKVFDSNKINKEDMEELKNAVKNTTHAEIMSYLENFNDGQMRYDMILNNLIENVLEDIYPDAYYLSQFNASSHTLLDVVRTIPSLISYTKYSADRYSEVFFKYQEVLEKIAFSLNSTWTNVEQYATQYIKVSDHILNETHVESDLFESFNRTSLEQVNMNLESGFNQTEVTSKFILDLEVLRRNLIKEMVMRPTMINTKLGDMTQKVQVRDLISIFDSVANNSIDVINSLFSYGFWVVTDSFAQHF